MKIRKKDVLEIIVAFAVAWVFYQGLAVAFDSPMPIVSVVSGSMEPVMHRGDLAVVTGMASYEIGDVVVYQKPEIPYTIVHRIISKQTYEDGTEKYTIKGDNNNAPDPLPVAVSEIQGKVQFAIPLLGYPRLALMIFGI